MKKHLKRLRKRVKSENLEQDRFPLNSYGTHRYINNTFLIQNYIYSGEINKLKEIYFTNINTSVTLINNSTFTNDKFFLRYN